MFLFQGGLWGGTIFIVDSSPIGISLGFSEKIFSDNYTFGSFAQLASVLPRPPPTESWERFGGGGARQDLGSLRTKV